MFSVFYTSADGASSRLVLGSRLQTHETPCVVVVIFVRLCRSLSVSHARSLSRLHFQLPVFFFRPNFDLKKNDFDLYKTDNSWKQHRQISEENRFPNRQIFAISFQYVAKNIEGFCDFFVFFLWLL